MVAHKMNARMKKRFHTSQEYARKVLQRERARYARNANPLFALIASTAASGNSMFARSLCELTNIADRLPAHIAFGFHSITAVRVVYGV